MSDEVPECFDGDQTWSSHERLRLDGTDRSESADEYRQGLSLQGPESRFSKGTPQFDPRMPRYSRQLAAKRAFDLVGGSVLLFVFGPLLMGFAFIVKLTSSGPVFFRQQRVGMGGVPFSIVKFRTMFVDRGDATGVKQTVADDPRVTPVGRWMRRFSIDELPQLINVVQGTMSLVGPRPHVPGQLAGGEVCENVIPNYQLRHLAKPGITGWAQVNGHRGPTQEVEKMQRRIDHDLAYIQNYSLLLDLKILVLTLLREFVTGSGS